MKFRGKHIKKRQEKSQEYVVLFVLQAIYDTTGERPTHRSYPCGTKLDSITQYERDLMVNL